MNPWNFTREKQEGAGGDEVRPCASTACRAALLLGVLELPKSRWRVSLPAAQLGGPVSENMGRAAERCDAEADRVPVLGVNENRRLSQEAISVSGAACRAFNTGAGGAELVENGLGLGTHCQFRTDDSAAVEPVTEIFRSARTLVVSDGPERDEKESRCSGEQERATDDSLNDDRHGPPSR